MQRMFTNRILILHVIANLLVGVEWTNAQDFSFRFDTSLKISQSGQILTNAFAGGLNAPQFSTCKLDNDGIDDLVVFDRTSQKLYTFLAQDRKSVV